MRRFWEGVPRGAEQELPERWRKIQDAKAHLRKPEAGKGRRPGGPRGPEPPQKRT